MIESLEALIQLLESAKSHTPLNNLHEASTVKFHTWLILYYERKQNGIEQLTEDIFVKELINLSQAPGDNLSLINMIMEHLIKPKDNDIVSKNSIVNQTSSNTDTDPDAIIGSTKKMLDKIGNKEQYFVDIKTLSVETPDPRPLLSVYDKVEQRMEQSIKALPPANLPTLPNLPILIFAEMHDDLTTNNIIKKLAARLKEKGYERFYLEGPQGLVLDDLKPEDKMKNFMLEMEKHKLEVRAIDQGSLDFEERQDFLTHIVNPQSALSKARNSTMAWHYAHADVPVIGSMGLSHLSEVQKNLVASRPESPDLDNHYLCIYAHSKDPRVSIESDIAAGNATKEDYPLGVLHIDTSSHNGENDAVELIIQKIEEKKIAIEQSKSAEELEVNSYSPGL